MYHPIVAPSRSILPSTQHELGALFPKLVDPFLSAPHSPFPSPTSKRTTLFLRTSILWILPSHLNECSIRFCLDSILCPLIGLPSPECWLLKLRSFYPLYLFFLALRNHVVVLKCVFCLHSFCTPSLIGSLHVIIYNIICSFFFFLIVFHTPHLINNPIFDLLNTCVRAIGMMRVE